MQLTPRKIVGATLTAAFVAAIVASTVPAHAAAPSAGAVLTVSPAHPDASVASGKAYFVYTLAPGGSRTDEVSVVNTTDSTISAWVDAVDGVTSIRTGAVYSARTVAAWRAGAWVRPHVVSVTVAPHMQTTVMFTVNVPAGASAGDHLAGIAFESKQGGSRSAGITTVLRSVVAVQVRVPGPAAFQLHLYSAAVGPLSTSGASGVTLDMEDVGGLLGKPQLEVNIDGPAGYHRADSVRLDTMLPGDRIMDEILWPDVLAAGEYRLSVTEVGSGRHGAAFLSTAHLAAAVHPSSPVTRSIAGAVPTVASSSFPAWILFGGLVGGAGAAGAASLLVASGRLRRVAQPGMLR
jgi:hypothetical protein